MRGTTVCEVEGSRECANRLYRADSWPRSVRALSASCRSVDGQAPAHAPALALNAEDRTWTTCPALFIPSIAAIAQAEE